MAVRGLRGAITVDADDPAEILQRTTQLLTVLFERNGLARDCVISLFFTATRDLRTVAPAAAARAMGLTEVPLMCGQEMDVEGSLERCIRLLAHVETERPPSELRHAFLRDATRLRPELVEPGDEAL